MADEPTPGDETEHTSPEDIEAHKEELATAEEEQDELLVLLRENAEIMADIRDEMRRYHSAKNMPETSPEPTPEPVPEPAPEPTVTEQTIVARRKDETPARKPHKRRGVFY